MSIADFATNIDFAGMSDEYFLAFIRGILILNHLVILQTLDAEQLRRAYRLGAMSLVAPLETYPVPPIAADVIEFVLANDHEKSVPLDLRDKVLGTRPLERAIAKGSDATAHVLLRHGARPTLWCFYLLVNRGNVELQYALLKTGYRLTQEHLNALAWCAITSWYSIAWPQAILEFYASLGVQFGTCHFLDESPPVPRVRCFIGDQNYLVDIGSQRKLLQYCLTIGTPDASSLPTDSLVPDADRRHIQRQIHRRLFQLVCPDALYICTALQNLELPASVTIEIIDHACVGAHHLPFHWKWNLVTRVKHFHNKPK